MQPFCAPLVRRMRVSLRVSMLAMADRVLALQVLLQGHVGAEAGGDQRQVADDQAGGVHLGGFDVFGVDAVVADVRIGERDDLLA
jgi:hypothetical protein